MNRLYLWQIIKLARLPIVFAVIPTFLIGTFFALAQGTVFSPVHFLWGFSILFIIEIAASFANDYFDYDADKHNKQFGFSGGSGVLLEYPELLSFAKWASVSMFVLALVLTSFFIIIASLPLWVLGYIGVAVFFCWFYTAPPFRFVYRGLGEFPHLLAGIMFPGWGYLILTGTLTFDLLVFAIPFGLFGLTVILNFEIPDREADIHSGKQTLIVRKGRYFAFAIIMVLYLASFLTFLLLSWISRLNSIINLWAITLVVVFPLILSIVPVYNKIVEPKIATKYAIRNSIAGFLTVILITFIVIF